MLKIFSILFISLLAMVGCAESNKSQLLKRNESTYLALEKFNSFFINLKTNYYTEIDDNALIDLAIENILESLDPYSTKISVDNENTKALETIKYNNFGVLLKKSFIKTQESSNSSGVSSFIEIDGLKNNSLAQKIGLKEGDLITHINNQDISHLSLKEIQNKLVSNDVKNIKIYRPKTNTNKVYDINFKALENTNKNITYKYINNIMYIKINIFNAGTSKILEDIINTNLNNNKNTKGLLLDLRNNPGGLLEEAIDVSNLFLNFGLIVSIPNLKEQKNTNSVKKYLANTKDILNNLPVVILINNSSASASEIVAGSLQDNNRAVLVGDYSYGKNLIQTIIPIGNNEFYKITTASYLLPKSNDISGRGLTPNFVIKNNKQQLNFAIDLINNN